MRPLRKMEKKELLDRLTPLVGRAIEQFVKNEAWTDIELANWADIPANRITEYKYHERYGRVISEKHLVTLMGKEVVSIEELLPVAASEEEKAYLMGIKAIESQSLRDLIAEAHRAGIDVEKLIQDALKNK